MGPGVVAENEEKFIGDWPNSYTFTKFMAEQCLKKNRGNMRLAIIRPSLIISCYEEPCQGWTDTVSAAGGITYTMHSGLLHYLYTSPTGVSDLIPCDFVTNMLIALTCYTAK